MIAYAGLFVLVIFFLVLALEAHIMDDSDNTDVDEFWEEYHEAYKELREDEEAWEKERKERKLWENTLQDGLEDLEEDDES